MPYREPRHVIIADMDPATRAIWLPRQEEKLINAFSAAESQQEADRLSYLRFLERSLRQVSSPVHNSPITYSVLYDEQSARATEALLLFGGFSDQQPATSAQELYNYLQAEPHQMRRRAPKEQAQPNSWGPLLRSGTVHAVLTAAGIYMPVITIFSPLRVATDQQKNVQGGDYAAFGEVATTVTASALQEVHATTPAQTTLHLLGLSLGAQEAVGAAGVLSRQSTAMTLGSLTVQEVILGPRTLREADAYRSHRSDEFPYSTEGHRNIPESALRMALDKTGGETFAMLRRMAGSTIVSWSLLQGVTKPEQTIAILQNLAAASTPVTIAVAATNPIARDPGPIIPANAQYITIGSAPGRPIGHIVNEGHNIVAATAYYGLTFKPDIYGASR